MCGLVRFREYDRDQKRLPLKDINTKDQPGERGEGGRGEDQQRVQVGTEVHEANIFWAVLGMGGAPRLLLLSVFFLLLLAQTELASYQTSIAEEEIPEERAGDEEEPGEQKFPFLVMSGESTFNILNVSNGHMEPLISAASSAKDAQTAFFFEVNQS